MKNHFFITLLLAASAVALPVRVHAGFSLYDASRASQPPAALGVSLGPKSAELKYDPRMIHAAEIALRRAHSHPTMRCWHYVKDALVQARVISSRPDTRLAKEAGAELCEKFGFRKLSIEDPRRAPIGAVLVYGGRNAGHVEIRTATGFVSDFISMAPSRRPLLGIYVKPV